MQLHRNEYFAVYNRNGYYTIEFAESQVIVLPIVDVSNVLMIKAKRPVLNGTSLEFPAGAVMDGERLKGAALRELHEETGIRVEGKDRLLSLPSINAMPSRTPHSIIIFQVDISRKEYDQREMHDDEVIGLELLSFSEAIRKVVSGEIFGSSHIALLLTYLVKHNKLILDE